MTVLISRNIIMLENNFIDFYCTCPITTCCVTFFSSFLLRDGVELAKTIYVKRVLLLNRFMTNNVWIVYCHYCDSITVMFLNCLLIAGKIHISQATKSALDSSSSNISGDMGFDVKLRGQINVKVRLTSSQVNTGEHRLTSYWTRLCCLIPVIVPVQQVPFTRLSKWVEFNATFHT